ncbi:hypothetical protein AgCh_017488 [Apium graveolens]
MEDSLFLVVLQFFLHWMELTFFIQISWGLVGAKLEKLAEGDTGMYLSRTWTTNHFSGKSSPYSLFLLIAGTWEENNLNGWANHKIKESTKIENLS